MSSWETSTTPGLTLIIFCTLDPVPDILSPHQSSLLSEVIGHVSDYLKTYPKERRGSLPSFLMIAPTSEGHHLYSTWIQPAEPLEGEMCYGPPLFLLSYLCFWPCVHTHFKHDHVFCKLVQVNRNRLFFFFFTERGFTWYVGYFVLALFMKKAVLGYFHLKIHHLYNLRTVMMYICLYMVVFGHANKYCWSLTYPVIQLISENKTSSAESSRIVLPTIYITNKSCWFGLLRKAMFRGVFWAQKKLRKIKCLWVLITLNS